MTSNLPTKLGNSPLVDAIFEVRFDGDDSLSSVLPGLIYSNLGCSKIEKLPHADIPAQIRDTDQNLKYIPLLKLSWDNYIISIGDKSLTIVPLQPYPGWSDFRERITKIIDLLATFKFIKIIERFSFKYINVFEEIYHKDIYDTLCIDLTLGSQNIDSHTIQIRAETPQKDGTQIIQILGRAMANLPSGKTLIGILVDIDTIQMVDNKTLESGLEFIRENLDKVRERNKGLFFSLLTENGLQRLEPSYE